MRNRIKEAATSIAKGLIVALAMSLVPMNAALATPATIQSFTSQPSITSDGASVFDVSWQFGSGTPPSTFFLLTCKFNLDEDPNLVLGTPYSIPGTEYFFSAAAGASITTNGQSSGSHRETIDINYPGIFFFRVLAQQPANFTNALCSSEDPDVPTTTFKMSMIPLGIEKATNAYSTSQVAYTDFVTPDTQDSENVDEVTTHSAPLARFTVSDALLPLIGDGSLRLRTWIDGAPEPTGLQNTNPCSRSLPQADWRNGSPSTQDAAGSDLWFRLGSDLAYVTLCNWGNFPISSQEQSDPDFQGREVSSQLWANFPTWFPDPTEHYGQNGDPENPNPDLFTTSPLTSALTLNYTTGNAGADGLTFSKASLTSAEATWTLPTRQSQSDLTLYHYLVVTKSSSVTKEVRTYFTYLEHSPGENQVVQLSNLETTTHSAQLFYSSQWSTWRTDAATAELSRVTVSFAVGEYVTTRSDFATFSSYVGQVIELPVITDSSVLLVGWVAGPNLTQGGQPYTLSDDVVFTADLRFRDSKIRGLTVSHSVNDQVEFFPAFDPDIDTYYLNVGEFEFEDLTITVTRPRRGVVSAAIDAGLSQGPLETTASLSGQSWIYTIVKEDIRSFGSPRVERNRADLVLLGTSEFEAEQSIEGSSTYTVRIARDPGVGVFEVSLSISQDVTGDTSDVASGGMRYVALPEQGSLSKQGYAFAGWQEPDTQTEYEAGQIIYLDRNLVLEPIWFDLRNVDFLLDSQIRYLQSDEQWIEYPLDDDLDPTEVSFWLSGTSKYRVSLYGLDGDIVSRYNNVPSLSNENVNADAEGLSTCVTQDDCLSVFTVGLELWDQTISDGVSFGIHVMRTTTSGEVCLTINSLDGPNSGSRNFNCHSEPGWMDLPDAEDFEDVFEIDNSIFPLWQGDRLGDQRVLLGFRLDPSDSSSRLYELNERYPLFVGQTLTAIWAVDEQNTVTEISIFGSSYAFADCVRENALPAEVKCLVNVDNPEQRIYPYGSNANHFYLEQDFIANYLVVGMQSGRDSDYSLDVQDGQFERLGFYSAQNDEDLIYRQFTDEELCPEGYCGVVHEIEIYSDSIYGTNDYELYIHVLRKPDNPVQLNVDFSMAGGVGLATQSRQAEAGWVMPPDIASLKKPGFIAQNWLIDSGGQLLSFSKDRPVPIWRDNLLISVGWVPAYTVTFMDGFPDSPLLERLFPTSNAYWVGAVPTASHPLGNQFLGWTYYPGSDFLVQFDTDIAMTEDAILYAVWSTVSPPAPAPNPPAPSGNSGPPPTPSISVSPSISPPIPATNSPSASTTIGVKRVNGLTQVVFGLPAKYVGKTATIEVKRWIKNQVRYFLIDASKVQAPDESGRASLTFDFKLKLKSTDVIRIKVGKVEVFKERLQDRS